MNTNKQDYINIQNDVLKYSKEYQEAQSIETFTSHIDEKLNNFKPTIMVYGTYNAGKSTLLNALFGQDEMAKTGDSPETSTISEYEYNGYTIYDTPGINAPQEHEEVTNEHLKKCELILFVLTNDGSFEELFIYEKISEIVLLEKPILIVINNKAGTPRNSQEEKDQMDKINLNLSKIGIQNNIESIERKVNICMVNAKSALKGKVENKKLLLENSNIQQLEYDIDKLLSSSGNSEVVNALNLFISDFINDTLTKIDTKIDNPEMQKTQELITYLEKLKQSASVDLKNIAIKNVTVAIGNIPELLINGNTSSLNEMITKTTEAISDLISQKISQIDSELKNKITNFNDDFKEIALDNPTISISDISNKMQDLVKEENIGANISAVGTTIATIIPPTTVIPTPYGPIPVKPVLMALSTIVSIFYSSNQAKKNAQAQIEQQQAKYLSAKNKADEFGLNLENQATSKILEVISSRFDNIITTTIALSSTLQNNNTKLLEDKRRLQQLLNKLR